MKRSVSLSERRERILRDEDTLRELRERLERFLSSPRAGWLAGSALLVNMFVVGYIERM